MLESVRSANSVPSMLLQSTMVYLELACDLLQDEWLSNRWRQRERASPGNERGAAIIGRQAQVQGVGAYNAGLPVGAHEGISTK